MKNIFSIDLEDWYHANYPETKIPKNKQKRVVKSTQKLLKLLKKTRSKATFFVLGEIAQSFPKLIQDIYHQGHEIASHSFSHQLVYKQTQKEFEKDLKKSISIIKKITNQKPIGYRAPSWSVNDKQTPWFWKTLKKHGFLYSSSLFPFKTFLYGDNTAPLFIHKKSSLWEIPPSCLEIFKKRIPFSGGTYLRLLSAPFIKTATKIFNKKYQKPTVFYIHPREIDPHQPQLDLSFKNKFLHYYKINNTQKKLHSILAQFPTQTIKNYIQKELS